ncbi:MAG: efflux RND transporter permease subunit [Xanthomonadales bacterium]|nr:efflux RND transporter permease subunit [Xanthomonadales bacterium]
MTDAKKGFTALAESFVFGLRLPLVILFAVITAVMLFYASQLKVDAGFKKGLPLQHEYMQTFLDYEKEYGGANRLLVAVMAEDRDIFDPEFFETFEAVTNEVFFVPGVNRPSVRSIFTPNVRFTEVVEDGFAGGNVIPSDFAPGEEAFAKVRSNIVKAGIVGRLVAEDFGGAMVWADLLEEDPVTGETLDYQQVAANLEEIRTNFQDDEIKIHIIGFAKIVGDISEGAKSVIWFFGIAILITAVLLYLYTGSVALTILPLLCSLVAVIWQLGALRLLGYGIDPMNILTPFLVFAIGVSHGVQMINSWNNEMLFGGEEAVAGAPVPDITSLEAARRTFRNLLAPGSIALLSDTIGFLTILFIEIQIIRELATTAAIGVALIIFTNLILMPILLSRTKIKDIEGYRAKSLKRIEAREDTWRALSGLTNKPVATSAIVVSIALFTFGYFKGQDMQIGDSQAGVPELRPDSRYNLDADVISSRFSLGVDSISIIAETSDQACTEDFLAMENMDRFAWHMYNVEGVQQVVTLPWVAKIINSGWNEGNIRWRILPRDNFVMRQNLQNVETDTGLLNANCDAMPIIVFTEDHKATTIKRVVDTVKEYRREYDVGSESEVSAGIGNPGQTILLYEPKPKEELERGEVNFRLGTGNVGVAAAVNEVVEAAQFPMLVLVYLAIIILCSITFRSLRGTICIVVPLALVSVLAYALMAFLGIGLKTNTLPVVALGVGIGVDYGIYIYSRLAQCLKEGMPLREAYYHALKQTGKPVIFTAFTLAIGVGTWIFSALQFQADMGKLLAFMFFLNMVGAVVLLPALARWLLRPKEA